jgi:hypothetical protein
MLHTYLKLVFSISEHGRLPENFEIIAVRPAPPVCGLVQTSTLHEVPKLRDILNNPLKGLWHTRASDQNLSEHQDLSTP